MATLGNAIAQPPKSIRDTYRAGHDLRQSDLGKLLLQRRAIKYFATDIDISDETVDQIISIASLAPSAFNLQHWIVFQIKSREMRGRVAELAYHQPQLYQAPVVLAVVMDTEAWNSAALCELNFGDSGKSGKDYLRLQSLYQDKEQLARDEALRSSSMFSMLIMLAAEAAGLNSCPLTGCNFPAIRELLQLPPNQELCMLITIGRAAPENKVRARKRLEPQRFFSRL